MSKAIALLFAIFFTACSSEPRPVLLFSSGKPELFNNIDSADLSMHVTVEGEERQYPGELRADGRWHTSLAVTFEMQHSFVASWFVTVNDQPVLLLEQNGEFFASESTQSVQPATSEITSGPLRFDSDCDSMTNLVEFEVGSDPFTPQNCVESDDPVPPPDLPLESGFVSIPAGCFLMGSAPSDPFHRANQRQHEVCVEAFSMGRHEVTFAEISEFIDNFGVGLDRSRPVHTATWNDAVAYTQWLSSNTGRTYRLPTEAEWEYAARGGTSTPFWTGTVLRDDQEHFDSGRKVVEGVDLTTIGISTESEADKQGESRPVGELSPNPFGLYDMLGNLMEFTCSLYSENYENELESQCDDNPDQRHVFRGGNYGSDVRGSLVYERSQTISANERHDRVGFRVVLEEP